MKEIELESIVGLLYKKLGSWFETGVKMIPNIVAAVAIFLIFFLIARVIRKVTQKLLKRVTHNRAVQNLLNTVVYLTFILIGCFVCLEILNLDKAVTSILAGAGVIGLALGFAFQEIASNFVSGVLIAFKEPYKIGDIVEVDDYIGEVKRITFRTTRLITFQGLEVLIPNKYMFTEPMVNYTTTPKRRLDISVGVSYDDDLELVEKVTRNALESTPHRIEENDIEVYFEEFGGSSINLSARVWIEYPANKAYVKAKSFAIKSIKKAYDNNGISIPFPIRTLDFPKTQVEEIIEHTNHVN